MTPQLRYLRTVAMPTPEGRTHDEAPADEGREERLAALVARAAAGKRLFEAGTVPPADGDRPRTFRCTGCGRRVVLAGFDNPPGWSVRTKGRNTFRRCPACAGHGLREQGRGR